MPDESNHLYYARRSYFGPIPARAFCKAAANWISGGAAGYRPRVRIAYSTARLSS